MGDEERKGVKAVSIAAVIITKDEEKRVSRCIEGVRWVNEIVVVDDFSQDDTVGSCRNLGAKVIIHKSDGNFDRQRNIGIDNAGSEWILQLDADEVVGERLKEKILGAINDPGEYSAFKFKRKNYFLGHFLRYCGEYNYYTKLFRRDKARYIGKSVHETLEVPGEAGIIDADIDHIVFESLTQYIDRQNFYSSIESKLLLDEKGILPIKVIKRNLTIKPIKLFWKLYVRKNGYKDGMYGFIWCLMQSVRRILIWSKYWELIK